jgi:hypothetical protein
MRGLRKMSNVDSGQQHPGWRRAYSIKDENNGELSWGIGRERTEQES